MTTKFKIIKADLSYFDKFYNLFEKTLKQKYFLYSRDTSSYVLNEDLTRTVLQKSLGEKKHILYLALIDDNIIGYLLVKPQGGGIAFGHWLAVDKKFQRKGIASALLSFWEKESLKEGAHKVQLWTTKNDIQFYKNRGYVLGGEFPDSWFGVDHFLFYKTLQKSDEKNFLKDYLAKKGKM